MRGRLDKQGYSRPSGPPTEEELAAVRKAYAAGCRGEVVIGMRGSERVVTMLVPRESDASQAAQRDQMSSKLRRIGCDACIRIRRGDLPN